MSPHELRVSTPGRICLFGEHQDYLGLPVLPCAISLRISIVGDHRSDRHVEIHLPDIAGRESFLLEAQVPYVRERDYLRSAVNVLQRNGFTFSKGMECEVHGKIPINAGTSSSSALVVAWVSFLARMSDQRRTLPPQECARYAHAAEVTEFGEPGGMMDHYSTAFGGILFLKFLPEIDVERLKASLGAFVLGDSGEPKNTTFVLAQVKNRVLDAVRIIVARHPEFSLQSATPDDIERHGGILSSDQVGILLGTLRNRDLTCRALELMESDAPDDAAVGSLLSEHQAVLRDVLHISTPRIDRMLDAAMNAGAYGGKINGSGGGGCMFAYAPVNPEQVAEAVETSGGRAYIVRPAEGLMNEPARGD